MFVLIHFFGKSKDTLEKPSYKKRRNPQPTKAIFFKKKHGFVSSAFQMIFFGLTKRSSSCYFMVSRLLKQIQENTALGGGKFKAKVCSYWG